MSTGEPAGEGGGGGGGGEGSTPGDEQSVVPGTPVALQPGSHPPPSPLSGCYLLVVLPEPHTAQHKDLILNRLAKGFLSWDKDSCHVDLEKELQALVSQAPEGEEARNGERLIQYATENLVTEVLIHPQTNTLLQCIRNLLASFTKHRHIIHAGYTFSGNGSWILQDGTFSLADFLDAFGEHEVQRVLHAYENSVTVDIHCAGVGDWTTMRISKEACTRSCRVRVNPDDVLTAGVPAITSFTTYIGQYLMAQTLDQLMEPSDVVGNIRFSHPTLYVFPGGQGDAALFGINGFNMLVDGGFARKACFWDFARHLDRLDAVLVTRINNSNVGGMSSVLRKKKETHVYPQIGHFFCNLVERRQANSPDGDKDIDPLILNLTDLGQEMMVNLRHINLRAHPCYRDTEPVNLYHKVGHGTLDMYVLSPSKDSREVREFLAKWHSSDSRLFAGSHKKDTNHLTFPIQNMVSICALLVWQPANPEDTITRILFPGSTPQNKIFEGLDRLKHLDFMKHPVCSAKSLSPSTSLATLKDKPSRQKGAIIDKNVDKDIKKLSEIRKEKRGDGLDLKTAKGVEEPTPKPAVPSAPIIPTRQPVKVEVKTKKVVENRKIEREIKTEKQKIEKELKEVKKEMKKEIMKVEKHDAETKKTDVVKTETEKTAITKEPKPKPEPKKKEIKETKTVTKTKTESASKLTPKPAEKKPRPSTDKKDIKSSPTTPKKQLNGIASKIEISRTVTKTVTKSMSKTSSSTPAKSAKEANNRKVVESKNIEMSSARTATSASSTMTAKSSAKPKPSERKPISRRPKPVSPSKPRLPGSPAKSTRSTPTASVKSDKDSVIRRVKGDKGTTDSSTVSTPSAIEPESVVKLSEKSLLEKSEDLSIDSIESKVLADLKEEREVVEEIEAVLNKAERNETARKDDQLEGDDEITAEATDKKEDDVTEEDVTAEIEDAPKKIGSRKESQELTEEDEYLIVEKEEIYTEDSVQSGEGEQKHLLDEVESEKRKEFEVGKEVPSKGAEEKEKEVAEEKEKDEYPEKKLHSPEKLKDDEEKLNDLSPENKEQLEEELKGIIASATEIVQKTEERDDSGKKDSEDITKEPSSLSPDKFDSSEKKTTDTDMKPEADQKEQVPEKLEESQERVSTLESGATTTAPTLPEDERIPLDEIKEDINEKQMKEEVKEKEILQVKEKIPEIPPSIPTPNVKIFDVRQTVQGFQRDIVKTPDEVADLPVHEEVDPKGYDMDEFDKGKEEKIPQTPETKEPPTPPVKEQKGMFSFFGKVADKFEKGMDKLTGKSKKDSEKDVDEKSSKSSSPKEIKPQDKTVTDPIDMDKVFAKVGKIEKQDTFEKVEPKVPADVKTAAIKETATFLQQEIKETKIDGVYELVDSESSLRGDIVDDIKPGLKEPEKDIIDKISKEAISKIEEQIIDLKDQKKDVPSVEESILKEAEAIEDTKEVEALLEEASKKFKTVKDSLRDSLESLEGKIDEDLVKEAELVSAKDKVTDTLAGVAERLEEIQPQYEGVASEVKFEIPKVSDDMEDDSEEDVGPFKDLKEAVRDVGEVLAGTAGIVIDDKPKDVIEIVKKVAEVLKEDELLSEAVLFDKTVPKDVISKKSIDDTPKLADASTKPDAGSEAKPVMEDMIIPKKVGVTEELPPQEEIEEMLEGGIAKPLPTYERAGGVEVQEEPCIKIVKDKTPDLTSPLKDDQPDQVDAKDLCEEMLIHEKICVPKEARKDDDKDKVDVMEAGIETVCTKKEVKKEFADEEAGEVGENPSDEEIEEPDIVFEQKLSPAQAEIVMVTPDSAPASPKFTTEKVYDKGLEEGLKDVSEIPKYVEEIITKKVDVHEIIEEFITRGTKITVEIIEYIIVRRSLPRERVIHIIEEIIIKRGVPRESVVENVEVLTLKERMVDGTISSEKRIEIEDYIVTEYVSKGKKITVQIIEEISMKKAVPRYIIIEIIEEIIIKRKMSRESVIEITEEVSKGISKMTEKIDTEISAIEDTTSVIEKKATSPKKEHPESNSEGIKEKPLVEATKEKDADVFDEKDIDEGKLIDDFVNIPSKDAVMSFLHEERRLSHKEFVAEAKETSKVDAVEKISGDSVKDLTDDFEAVEQEYKVQDVAAGTAILGLGVVSGISSIKHTENKDDALEAIEDDMHDVIEAAEKFVAETKEKSEDTKEKSHLEEEIVEKLTEEIADVLETQKIDSDQKQLSVTLKDDLLSGIKDEQKHPVPDVRKSIGEITDDAEEKYQEDVFIVDDALTSAASDVTDATEKYLVEAKEKPEDVKQDLKEQVKEAKDIADVLQESVEDIKTDLKDNVDVAVDKPGIEDKADDFKEISDVTKEVVSEKADDIIESLKQKIDDVDDGIKDKQEDAKDKVQETVADLEEVSKDKIEDFEEKIHVEKISKGKDDDVKWAVEEIVDDAKTHGKTDSLEDKLAESKKSPEEEAKDVKSLDEMVDGIREDKKDVIDQVQGIDKVSVGSDKTEFVGEKDHIEKLTGDLKIDLEQPSDTLKDDAEEIAEKVTKRAEEIVTGEAVHKAELAEDKIAIAEEEAKEAVKEKPDVKDVIDVIKGKVDDAKEVAEDTVEGATKGMLDIVKDKADDAKEIKKDIKETADHVTDATKEMVEQITELVEEKSLDLKDKVDELKDVKIQAKSEDVEAGIKAFAEVEDEHAKAKIEDVTIDQKSEKKDQKEDLTEKIEESVKEEIVTEETLKDKISDLKDSVAEKKHETATPIDVAIKADDITEATDKIKTVTEDVAEKIDLAKDTIRDTKEDHISDIKILDTSELADFKVADVKMDETKDELASMKSLKDAKEIGETKLADATGHAGAVEPITEDSSCFNIDMSKIAKTIQEQTPDIQALPKGEPKESGETDTEATGSIGLTEKSDVEEIGVAKIDKEKDEIVRRKRSVQEEVEETQAQDSKTFVQKTAVTEEVKETKEKIETVVQTASEGQDDKLTEAEGDDGSKDSGVVRRMVVTASSEDGGHEIELCPTGSITFTTAASPDDSLKEASTKSTPERDSLQLERDSLNSGKSTPEKDSISGKSSPDLKEDKVTPEDSLDKSPIGIRDSLIMEDSLEKSPVDKPEDIILASSAAIDEKSQSTQPDKVDDKVSEEPMPSKEKAPEKPTEISGLKSPGSAHSEDVSPAETIFGKSPIEKSPEASLVKEESYSPFKLPDVPKDEPFVKEVKQADVGKDVPLTTVSDEPEEKKPAETSHLPSVLEDTQKHEGFVSTEGSKSPSDKLEVRSRSSSVVSDKADRKDPISGSKSSSVCEDEPQDTEVFKSQLDTTTSIEIDKLHDKSRSSSIASETPEEKRIPDSVDILSKSSEGNMIDTIVGGDSEETAKSRSSSIVSDKQEEKITSIAVATVKADEKESTEDEKTSKTPSVAGDKPEETDIPMSPIDRSKSPSIASEKSDDKSRKPSIAGDKQMVKEIDDTIAGLTTEKDRTPSPITDKALDKSRSSSIVGEKTDDKDLVDEQKSPSIAGDKSDEGEKSPVDRSKEPEDKLRIASIATDKAELDGSAGDEETRIDRSKSPSIADDEPEEKAAVSPIDRSGSPGIAIEKPDASIISDKPEEKEKSPLSGLDQSIDKSRSASVVGEPIDGKQIFEKPVDKSRSPSIISDKAEAKELDDKPVDKSRSPSIISDKVEPKELDDKPVDKSRSPSIISDKAEAKELDDKPVDKSRSPSIISDKVEPKELDDKPVDKSRSPSIISDKAEEKGPADDKPVDESRSSSIFSDKAEEKGVDDKPADKSRSSSIISDKVDEKGPDDKPIDKSRSPSVFSVKDEEKRTDDKPIDKSRSPSIISDKAEEKGPDDKPVDKSRSSSTISEMSEGQESDEKSRSPSILSEKAEEKEPEGKTADKSRSPSIISEKAEEKELFYKEEDKSRSPSTIDKAEEKEIVSRSKSSSIVGDKPEEGKTSPVEKSRSPSIFSDEPEEKLKSIGIVPVKLDQEEPVEGEKTRVKRSTSPGIADEKLEEAKSTVEVPKSTTSPTDEPMDKSRSSSVVSDKLERKLDERSKSPSIDGDKTDKKDAYDMKSSKDSSPTHERTPMDRSRSHSLFDAGEKTPLGRSRAASLFEDKLDEKITLLAEEKSVFEHSIGRSIFEEKEEDKLVQKESSKESSMTTVPSSLSDIESSEIREADVKRSSEEAKVEPKVTVSSAKRTEIEQYIMNEYVSKNKRITTEIVDEMVVKKTVPRFIIIDIIKEIIIQRNISRESVLEVVEDAELETKETHPKTFDISDDISPELTELDSKRPSIADSKKSDSEIIESKIASVVGGSPTDPEIKPGSKSPSIAGDKSPEPVIVDSKRSSIASIAHTELETTDIHSKRSSIAGEKSPEQAILDSKRSSVVSIAHTELETTDVDSKRSSTVSIAHSVPEATDIEKAIATSHTSLEEEKVDSKRPSVVEDKIVDPGTLDAKRPSLAGDSSPEPKIVDSKRSSIVGDKSPEHEALLDSKRSSVAGEKSPEPATVDSKRSSIVSIAHAELETTDIDSKKSSVPDEKSPEPAIVDSKRSSIVSIAHAELEKTDIDSKKSSVPDEKSPEPATVDSKRSSVVSIAHIELDKMDIDAKRSSIADEKSPEQVTVDSKRSSIVSIAHDELEKTDIDSKRSSLVSIAYAELEKPDIDSKRSSLAGEKSPESATVDSKRSSIAGIAHVLETTDIEKAIPTSHKSPEEEKIDSKRPSLVEDKIIESGTFDAKRSSLAGDVSPEPKTVDSKRPSIVGDKSPEEEKIDSKKPSLVEDKLIESGTFVAKRSSLAGDVSPEPKTVDFKRSSIVGDKSPEQEVQLDSKRSSIASIAHVLETTDIEKTIATSHESPEEEKVDSKRPSVVEDKVHDFVRIDSKRSTLAGDKSPESDVVDSKRPSIVGDKIPELATIDSKRSSIAADEISELKMTDLERSSIVDRKSSESDSHSVTRPSIMEDKIIEPDHESEEEEDSQPGIEREIITISDAKRTEIEQYILEEYITRGKKITEELAQEIATRKAVPRYIILEIIEEMIFKRKVTRESVLDIVEEISSELAEPEKSASPVSIDKDDKPDDKLGIYPEDRFHDVTGKSTPEISSAKDQTIDISGKSTPDLRSSLLSEKYSDKSGYSTPDMKQFDDKSGKSTPDYRTEYESQFHKAFVGGMTEIRTTHITTLSGKSTPELQARDGTPEPKSESSERQTTVTSETKSDLQKTELSEKLSKVATTESKSVSSDKFETLTSSKETAHDGTKLLETISEATKASSTRISQSSASSTLTTKTITSEAGPEIASKIISPEVTPSMTTVKSSQIDTAPDVVTRIVKREIDATDSAPTTEIITKTIRHVEVREDEEEPEVIKKVIKREVIFSDEEAAQTSETVTKTMKSSDGAPDSVKRIISREGTPEVIETVTTRTTRTIVSEEIPTVDTMTKVTSTTSDIEKPELVTRVISREGRPEISETITRTTKTITSDSGPEYITKIISREGTPEIFKSADVKRIVTTVTTVTGPDGDVITTKDVKESADKLDSEDLLEKLIDSSSGDKTGRSTPDVKTTEERFLSETPEGLKTEEIIKRTVTTVTSTSGMSTPDVKMFIDSGKSTPDLKHEIKSDTSSKEQITDLSGKSTPDVSKDSSDRLPEKSATVQTHQDTAVFPLVKDLISDDKSYSGRSSPDISLPKDIMFSGSTGKSTPEIPASPLFREGAVAQPHPSERSTPDRKSEGRSRTATPEGFRSGEMIRTIITTTRTMSDDGEIITTTKEVTEATNEQGETVVLTEKTDVKVDDKLPSKDAAETAISSVIGSIKVGELKMGSSPGSDGHSDKDFGPISPRSDLSSGHSRAATHVWEGSSEERQTYSDDEPPSSPLSATSQLEYSSQPLHYESTSDKESHKRVEFSSEAMSSSFYGELPTKPPVIPSMKTDTQKTSEPIPIQGDYSFKRFTVEKEYAGAYEYKTDTKKYVDEADLDFERAMMEHREARGEDIDSRRYSNGATAGYTNGSLGREKDADVKKVDPKSGSSMEERKDKSDLNKDPLEGWGKPLGLPSPKPPRKFNLHRPVPSNDSKDLTPDSLNFDVINEWGEPLRLPSPAPPPNEVSNKGAPGTPKKERKQPKKIVMENNKNKKRSESPSKNDKKSKDSKNKVQPVYMDLTYVPHHGNSYYSSLEFFKRIRARYYVFSGTEPSREVYDALLEAKKTWEDKDLEVTMIPTYDTDTLGYWVADNEEALAANHIDLSPSASRCTINLQDHETSCSAYRLEF